MSMEKARACLASHGLEDRIRTFDVSSATVELAAEAVGCAPAQIAKTLSFAAGEGCILIVAAGDARIDNSKFKHFFGRKATMLPHDQAEIMTGHAVGGVCPFGVPETCRVCLDVSLKRFEIVYPAAGTSSSAVRLTPDELSSACNRPEWVDVCKDWR